MAKRPVRNRDIIRMMTDQSQHFSPIVAFSGKLRSIIGHLLFEPDDADDGDGAEAEKDEILE